MGRGISTLRSRHSLGNGTNKLVPLLSLRLGINRITTKTLRHYDRIGLIKPAKIDSWTGYRYYRAEQLPEMGRILMLRELGFSLAEIGEIIRSECPVENLLTRRAAALQREIAGSQRRLAKVLGYLENLGGEMDMNENVVIKELPEVVAASMRTVVSGYDTYFDIVPKMGEYMKSVGAVCRVPEYCFTIYHDGEYKEHDIDVEICEAVVAPCPGSDHVKFKTVPGYPEAVCLLHKGPYSTIGDTYNKLFSWLHEHGYTPADNPRESYIDGIWNKEDPEEWLTEVQVPVSR
jgi:DNA-binding transcriptional MerR regulator